jgi:hypothetical protein
MEDKNNDYKIFDTFCYNGEPIALLHIEYLYDILDMFIIVEARESHAGIKKEELYFKKYATDFAPYMDKIHYIIVENFSEIENDTTWQPEIWMSEKAYESWRREQYQRNYAMVYLKTIKYPYFLYCGDVDEIPDRALFIRLHCDPATCDRLYNEIQDALHIEMVFFYYNFKWHKIYKWYHAYLTTNKCVQKFTLSELRLMKPQAHTQYILNGGWHCSYFQSFKDIRRKCESFAHRECDCEEYKTDAHIQHCFNTGADIFNRGCFEDLKIYIGELPEQFKIFQDKNCVSI